MSGPGAPSLLTRLAWLHLLTTLGTVGVTAVLFVTIVQSTAQTYQRQRLQQRASAISRSLRGEGAGLRLALAPREASLFSPQAGGYAYLVLDETGRVRFRSAGAGPPHATAPPTPTAPRYDVARDRDGRFDVGSFAVTLNGMRLVIQVSQDLDNPDVIVDDIIREITGGMWWVAAFATGLLILLDLMIIRHSLRPVLRASHLAATITPERLDVRLPTADQPSEILPLLNAVNQALDRIARSYTAQKQFTADAAHELRTPLAILRIRIESACAPGLAQDLLADLDAASALLTRLLTLAELDSLPAPLTERVSLKAAAERVVGHFAPLAFAQGKQIELDLCEAEATVAGDADLIFLAARNLVENALKHTPAGPAASVRVRVSADADVRLSVTDQGTGVSIADAPFVFDRFWRRDKAQAQSAGLGLAIVSRIMELHGGAVSLVSPAGEGATFTLSFVPARTVAEDGR